MRRKVRRMQKMYKEALEQRKGKNNTYNAQCSLDSKLNKEFDEWLKLSANKKANSKGRFLIGRTSKALQSIGVKDYNIYWDKSSLASKMRKHPELTSNVVKQLPNLIENPVMVLRSLTVASSITLWGEVYSNGNPIMVALKLNPTAKTGFIYDFAIVTSAYERPVSQLQNFLDDVDNILYLDPNKNRTDNWLHPLGLQLPPLVSHYGSINTIQHSSAYVNK